MKFRDEFNVVFGASGNAPYAERVILYIENNFRVMTRTEAKKRLKSSYGNKKQVYSSFKNF